jgi:hypothetical protein
VEKGANGLWLLGVMTRLGGSFRLPDLLDYSLTLIVRHLQGVFGNFIETIKANLDR